ncbi:Biosynthetic arginine decarboxylase [Candidatus Desulfarcum epimagneticum]|uniref:Arginine decarboxylase n=1 Tax=uncultured Desulfobacteraceae bacterium TaxID=218296 RepID=A0A484HJZ7_9BACT|nr:Biosynthetic arginine decarboxylase [uncultured Desulfobacteraceae bacterium]
MPEWDIGKSKTLYNMDRWGENFFDIDPNGELTVSPTPGGSAASLYRLSRDFMSRGFSLPALVRFPGILRRRVERLRNAFETAMEKERYPARYMPVYPIKVNQRRQVVEAVLNAGAAGLEVGSKPELIAALTASRAGGLLICNGCKDRPYIRMALIAGEIGLKPYIVIEKISELSLIFREANRLNVTPRLGVRIKLASFGKGRWENSGGAKSKFGLGASGIIEAVSILKEAGLIQALRLMHFHIGSQIPNVHDIQKALNESTRFYAELRALGAPIEIVDVGGGLGVDYEGMMSSRFFSANYTIEEYANNVIYAFKEICDPLNLPRPDIITENGRAIVAHHAVFITDIVAAESVSPPAPLQPPPESAPDIISDLWSQLHTVDESSALEAYHNAVYWLKDMQIMFSYGVINLSQRALAERLFYSICFKARELLRGVPDARAHHETLYELEDRLADKYFANFSLFRSTPDVWAIDQLFPILPLQRLDEYPGNRATVQDLTCDSDGRFKKYVHSRGFETSLPAHFLSRDEPYLIGIFLVGAYQEILGDMHNLFGNFNSFNARIDEKGDYQLDKILKGESVEEILSHVDFDSEGLFKTYRKRLRAASLSEETRRLYMRELAGALDGHSYIDVNERDV